MTIERLRAETLHTAAGRDPSQAEFGEWGVLIDGKWIKTTDPIEVRSPYDGAVAAIIHHGTPAEVELAIATAEKAFAETRHLPSWKREEVLHKVSQGISERRETFARAIALEAGKPIRQARAEVDRAAYTFKVAAEEAKRIYGEIVPLDWLPGNEGRVAHVRRVPRGPVVGITPFNFPLNLVAHKVAPALAAGNPMIVRPDSQTPISALLLGQLILEAGYPAGGIAVVPTRIKDAAPFVEDERIKLLSFTGSPGVGWSLKARAGMKPVTLELGGNAGTIVHVDADIPYAASRVVWGGFSYSGQSCNSVQRVYIHEQQYEDFVDELLPLVKKLKVGNPLDEDTDIGPVIDDRAAERIAEWLKEAIAGGAQVLIGGEHDGRLWQPTVLAAVREEMRVSCQEVFAPLVNLYPYADISDAIRAVDNSEFGLQAGLFTNDLRVINQAFDQIQVGGLLINDVSSFRADHMPYGGVKRSGFGREGLRYAIEEMTEMKLLMINPR